MNCGVAVGSMSYNLLVTGGPVLGKTHIACALCITTMHAETNTVKYMH